MELENKNKFNLGAKDAQLEMNNDNNIKASEKEEVKSFSKTGPNGFSTQSKNDNKPPKKPELPIDSLSYNKANSTKIEKLDRFNTRSINVGFFTKTAADLMESQRSQKGNKSIHKMGLNTFDRKFRMISNAVRDDNPVADSIIFEIEKLINIASDEIKVLIYQMEQSTERFFVSHNAGISYDQDYAYSYEADWYNSISFKVMWLIKEADIYFNQVNLASKAAIITDQMANNYRHQVKNKLLNIMHFVNRYKHSNVTRKDFAYMTALAKKFLEESGNNLILRSEVLMLTKRGESAPRIGVRPNNKIDDIKEELEGFCKILQYQEDQEYHQVQNQEAQQELKKAF